MPVLNKLLKLIAILAVLLIAYIGYTQFTSWREVRGTELDRKSFVQSHDAHVSKIEQNNCAPYTRQRSCRSTEIITFTYEVGAGHQPAQGTLNEPAHTYHLNQQVTNLYYSP